MTVQTWALFCATETVLCFIPGPAVLFVVSSALTRGSRAGLQASLGILAANTAYFALSAMGLGAVLLASRTVFLVIKWIGAAYLVYLGARMIVSRPQAQRPDPVAPVAARRAGVFWNGLITQAANPKALIFFTALLPQFIDPDESAAAQIALLGASSVLIEFVVLALYVGTCRAARQWLRGPGFGNGLVRLGGLLLVIAGAKLAATRE
jgi:threonine/homoserine/homoserine lactone efflux protein